MALNLPLCFFKEEFNSRLSLYVLCQYHKYELRGLTRKKRLSSLVLTRGRCLKRAHKMLSSCPARSTRALAVDVHAILCLQGREGGRGWVDWESRRNQLGLFQVGPLDLTCRRSISSLASHYLQKHPPLSGLDAALVHTLSRVLEQNLYVTFLKRQVLKGRSCGLE